MTGVLAWTPLTHHGLDIDPLWYSMPTRFVLTAPERLFQQPYRDTAAVFGVMAAADKHVFDIVVTDLDAAAQWFRWVAEGEGDDDDFRSNLNLCAFNAWERIGRPQGFEWVCRWPLPNVRLGVRIERQAEVDSDIPRLIGLLAAERFVVTRDRSVVVPAAWLPDDAGDGEPREVVNGTEADPRSLDAVHSALAGGPVEATGIRGEKQVVHWFTDGVQWWTAADWVKGQSAAEVAR